MATSRTRVNAALAATTSPRRALRAVQFYDYFKKNCPTSYAYAYDESSGTALYTCDANLKADYTVTLPVAAMRTLWNR